MDVNAKYDGMRAVAQGVVYPSAMHTLPEVGPDQKEGVIIRRARLVGEQTLGINNRLLSLLRNLRGSVPAPVITPSALNAGSRQPLVDVMESIAQQLDRAEEMLNELENLLG